MNKVIDCLTSYYDNPKDKIALMVGALILKFVVVIIGAIILFNILEPMGIIDTSSTSSNVEDIDSIISKGYTLMILLLILAAFTEEMMFRFPLVLFNNGERYKQLIAVIGFSILFGYIHGNVYNIFMQGFGGLILSIVFLKCGGSDPFKIKNVLIGILCSTTVHATFNIIVISLTIT